MLRVRTASLARWSSSGSLFTRMLGKESNDGSPQFSNRWLMVAPAFATHLCIGAPYAWSIMSGAVATDLGFVAPAAGDWSLVQATIPMSIVFAFHGITAALSGKWQMRVGPRMATSVAALCFGGGFALGGVGIATHSLPLLYFGYGVLSGIGLGLAYTPPVQMLMQWFPDRKGLASGLTIAGFGSGALVFTPLANALMEYYSKMPQFVGNAGSLATKVIDGSLFAQVNGSLQEVVYATQNDIAKLPYDLAEGYYLVGSGDTGASMALATCGAIYLGTMLTSALAMKTPHPDVEKQLPKPQKGANQESKYNVNVDTVMKVPQFYMLATTFFSLGCGSIAILSVAKPMMNEVFSRALPAIVTSNFTSSFVLLLSVANYTGRIGYAAFSDHFGRKLTYQIFTFGSIPLYLSIPYFIHSVVETQSVLPLYGFAASTFMAVAAMGGVYATLPAYESDLFGPKYVGANHGRMLLASTGAALAGPSILLNLRSYSETASIRKLLEQVGPERFQSTFGAPIEDATKMIESKTVTINNLLAALPPEVKDPTPYIYDSTMYTMAGLMALAAIAHSRVRPVDSHFFEENQNK